MSLKTLGLNIPTLAERIPKMNDAELEELAAGEALAISDSCKLEGLTLDRDRIRKELIAGYRAIRDNPNPDHT